MKRLFLLIIGFFLSFSLVSATECGGCVGAAGDCYAFGDKISATTTSVERYCDYLTKSFVPTKTSGVCENDFECAGNYLCFEGYCTGGVSDFLHDYNLLLANLTNNTLCLGDNPILGRNPFCWNGTQPSNSTPLAKQCNVGSSCYKCNSNLNWNTSLNLCIKDICVSNPGCLNMTSLDNASIGDYYCADNKNCFECRSDYVWNATAQSCKLLSCTSTVGCLNQTSLINGKIMNRACSVGSCFSCNTSYRWDNSSKSCVSSSIIIDPSNDWTTIQFSQGDFDSGTEKLLRSYDRLQFAFEGRTYYLGVLSIDATGSKITYKIEPILNNLIAYLGVENRFDLNSDTKSDLLVKLVAIENGNARVKAVSIRESYEPPINQSNNTVIDNPEPNSKENYKLWLILAAGILALVIIIFIVFLIRSSPKEKSVEKVDTPQVVNWAK